MKKEKQTGTNWTAIAIGITLGLTILNISQLLSIKQDIADINRSDALALSNRLEMDDELHALTHAIIDKNPDLKEKIIKARQAAILYKKTDIN